MDAIGPSTPSWLTEGLNVTAAMTAGGDSHSVFHTFAWKFFSATLALLRVYPAVILCIGTVGNVMTVVIMRRLTSEESAIHIYFTALAGVDLLYLWTIVFNWVIMYNLDYDFKTVDGVFCKIFTWLYTGVGTVSCWYLVCMTVHRAMSVVWPHRVHVLCTRRTVFLVLIVVTGVVGLLYCHYLAGVDVVSLDEGKTYRCTMASPDYIHFHSNVFVYVELLVYSALPSVVLVLANAVLTWKLLASAQTAGRNLTEGSSSQARSREKAANSVTLTVMALSLTFLVLTLPSNINFILSNLIIQGRTETSQTQKFMTYAVSIVTSSLSHTNHAVNFYLYCLTGRRFREEFLKVLCCGRGGQRLRALSGKEAASG
ncbi:hypothetical protein ACOMHN_030440 [Nucella lapillus]